MGNDDKLTKEQTMSELKHFVEKKIDESNHQNEKKILEAKIFVSERRVTVLLAFLALLGIIYPLYKTDQNTEKVDKSITSMEERFSELAEKHLRKPDIVCEVNGESLLNKTLVVSPYGESSQIFQIKNIGDASAGPASVYLYLKNIPEELINFNCTDTAIDYSRVMDKATSNDPSFAGRYRAFIIRAFHAKTEYNTIISYNSKQTTGFDTEVPAMLKIYYEGPEPYEVPFTMKFISKKQQN